MKKSHILLVALSSTLLLFGCGSNDGGKIEYVEPVVEIIEEEPEPIEIEEPEPEEEVVEDIPPAEGMVRSRITNEWVTEEVNNTRPVSVMTPNTKTA
ncbi:MAG: DUF3048 domain-containing protein, partial [Lachnospiraceae bacterium]|nr:DUF3048 domain-containing protein [Lachnospiraceae bacterium]